MLKKEIEKKWKFSGFSLIEVLVGIGIITIVCLSLYTLISFTLKVIWESQAKITATQLGNQKIEMALNLPYEEVGTEGGIPAGVIPASEIINRNGINYNITTDVQYVDDPFDGTLGGSPNDTLSTDYKIVRVQISWPYRLNHQPIILITNITPPGLETAAGGGTLKILVYNSIGSPVGQAEVEVINTAVSPEINIHTLTDDQGYVILPGSPASTEGYKITVARDGYSSEKTYDSTAELPSPEKPHASVFDGELTNISFAIDKLSDLNVSTITGDFSNWWNDGWTKRKEITTNNSGGSLNNYQLKIELPYDADMQADFDDVRFADRYGVALDYWRETYTASVTATFWVEVNLIPNGQGYFYVYYGGNESVATTSSGKDTFLFFDDFEDYSLGSLIGQGEWIAYGSYSPYIVSSDTAYSGSKSAKSNNTESWIKTSSMALGPGVFIDYWVKMTNKGNNSTADFFFQSKSATEQWDRIGHRGQYSINNWYKQLGYTVTDSGKYINLNTWQHMQMAYYNGYKTDVWIDGTKVANNILTYVTDLDYIILGNDENDRGYFDKMIVRRYNPPEPTTALGEEEEHLEGAYYDLGYINFDIKGAKIIGYDDQGLPVNKYADSFTTGADGKKEIADLEWDTYTLSMPLSSSYNIAETNPIQPYNLMADSKAAITLTLLPKATHSALIILKDINGQPLNGAEVHLFTSNPAYNSTLITNDSGQVYFSPWIEASTTLNISLAGYQNYSNIFDLSGYHIEVITLTEN